MVSIEKVRGGGRQEFGKKSGLLPNTFPPVNGPAIQAIESGIRVFLAIEIRSARLGTSASFRPG